MPPHLYPLPQNGGEGRVRGTLKKVLGSITFAKLNSSEFLERHSEL